MDIDSEIAYFRTTKYITNTVGLIVTEKYGINLSNTRDPQKVI